MTATEPDVQWYIARDGKQYGPVSAVEMAKLVELSHLKPTDLLWRPGFADWRPALTVFPPAVAPAAPAHPAPSSAPVRAASAPQPLTTEPERAYTDNRAATAEIRTTTESRPAQVAAEPRGAATAPVASTQALSGDRGEPSGNRLGRKLAAAAAVALAVAATAGYFVVSGRNSADKDQSPPVVAAASAPTKVATAAEPAAAAQAAATSTPVDAATVEARLQQSEVWQFLKRDYSEWYDTQIKGIAALPDGQRTQLSIDGQLVSALVKLRRENADKALSASTDKLKRVASAFLDNLGTLARRDVNACFSFISQGESSPAVTSDIVKGTRTSPMQEQIMAILDAIADGAKSPRSHDKPQKADYDALAEQLTRLGWSQADLQLFADPKALARAEPAKVCKMVQDWFTAHLAIGDAAIQERLLVETLRPVVAG